MLRGEYKIVEFSKAMMFGIVTLISLIVLYLFFLPILEAKFRPILYQYAIGGNETGLPEVDEDTKIAIASGYALYFRLFRILIFTLFFMTIIFMIAVAIRSEEESQYTGR